MPQLDEDDKARLAVSLLLLRDYNTRMIQDHLDGQQEPTKVSQDLAKKLGIEETFNNLAQTFPHHSIQAKR